MTMPIAYPWSPNRYLRGNPTYIERHTNIRGTLGSIYFDTLKNTWTSWCEGDEDFEIHHNTKEDAMHSVDGFLASRGIYLL